MELSLRLLYREAMRRILTNIKGVSSKNTGRNGHADPFVPCSSLVECGLHAIRELLWDFRKVKWQINTRRAPRLHATVLKAE